MFWLHDLKNAVYNIVQQHRIPRLMDEITAPVIRHLLDQGHNIIYVRPSPDKQTIDQIKDVVDAYPDYQLHNVRLIASYDNLLQRATSRDDPHRISNKEDLDEYLLSRQTTELVGEHVIDTDALAPEQVASRVLAVLK